MFSFWIENKSKKTDIQAHYLLLMDLLKVYLAHYELLMVLLGPTISFWIKNKAQQGEIQAHYILLMGLFKVAFGPLRIINGLT